MEVLTRAYLRDWIRRNKLNIIPPVDLGQGNPGDQPANSPYPTNPQLNNAITLCLSDINRRCGITVDTEIAYTVPSTAAFGPQAIPLDQIQSPTESVNTIQRVVYTDSDGGTPQVLNATSWQIQDRYQYTIDSYQPGVPTQYYVESRKLFLLPGSADGGTLSIYAGVGFTHPANDGDFIRGLPSDYHDAVITGAAVFWLKQRMADTESQAMIQVLAPAYESAVNDIKIWKSGQSTKTQFSFGLASYRVGPGLQRVTR